MALADALINRGFINDTALQSGLTQIAADLGMGENGSYKVLACYSKGDVSVTVEQNQSPEVLGGGMSAVVTHPPLAIVVGPKGRIAANPDDIELVVSLISDLG